MGYKSATAPKNKYTSLAVSFQDVGKNGEIAIKDLLKEKNEGKGASSGVALADKILVWDSQAGYTTYFRHTTGQWRKSGENAETTDTVKVGNAVFYQKGTAKDGEFTVSGEVFGGDSPVFNLPKNKYTFVANPWPVDLKIKDVGALITNAGKGASSGVALADKILLWDPATGYTTYFRHTTDTWRKSSESVETADTIPAGSGFFIQKGTAKDGTITFTKPEGL